MSRLRRYFFDRVCDRGYNIRVRESFNSRKKKLYLAIAIRLRKFAEVSLLIAFFISSKKKKKDEIRRINILFVYWISLRYQFYTRYVSQFNDYNVIIWRLVGFLFSILIKRGIINFKKGTIIKKRDRES